MSVRKIVEDVFSVGSIDWDRRLFDELIPLPEGTTYNSYLIRGTEKTALIDTVDPLKKQELLNNIGELQISGIDYIIVNHAEQDHSGSIGSIFELFPQSKVICSPKCADLLTEHLLIDSARIISVGDGQTISLGNKTLRFISAAWVHWPETMLTYLEEDCILFPCDLFGSHYASSALFARRLPEIYIAAKRYYAEIMMPFRHLIKKHLQKIDSLQIALIAASHGPIYDQPDFIIDAYKEWTSDDVKEEVVVPYVSMHGSVKSMVDHFIEALIKKDLTVKPFNL
ncbi:FprA family A-type flavoprotein, partial [Elusimicrobiota bacterium]